MNVKFSILRPAGGDAPILLVPYMWIGDFVRCHSVVKLLRHAIPTGRSMS